MCAHTQKSGGLEPFHFLCFKESLLRCMHSEGVYLFCFLDTTLAPPSTLGRAFGFIVQIAASIPLLLIFRADGRLEHWARHVFDERRKKDRLSEGDMCFLSKLLLYIWERSDVWDYSEALYETVYTFWFFFWLFVACCCYLSLLSFNQGSISLVCMRKIFCLRVLLSHYICLHVQTNLFGPIHIARLFHLGIIGLSKKTGFAGETCDAALGCLID
jgi:hypothetical protein